MNNNIITDFDLHIKDDKITVLKDGDNIETIYNDRLIYVPLSNDDPKRNYTSIIIDGKKYYTDNDRDGKKFIKHAEIVGHISSHNQHAILNKLNSVCRELTKKIDGVDRSNRREFNSVVSLNCAILSICLINLMASIVLFIFFMSRHFEEIKK